MSNVEASASRCVHKCVCVCVSAGTHVLYVCACVETGSGGGGSSKLLPKPSRQAGRRLNPSQAALIKLPLLIQLWQQQLCRDFLYFFTFTFLQQLLPAFVTAEDDLRRTARRTSATLSRSSVSHHAGRLFRRPCWTFYNQHLFDVQRCHFRLLEVLSAATYD